MSKSRILNVASVSLNGIRENKLLAKISEFTVLLKILWYKLAGQGISVTQASHYNICYLL